MHACTQVTLSLFMSIIAAQSLFVWRERQHAHHAHIFKGALCSFKAVTLLSQVGPGGGGEGGMLQGRGACCIDVHASVFE